ncbi:Uncharacterised protein [Rhodococcus erythropolis]|nr:Uncharacterised protein [Rhodococcus erythropolis]
MIGYLPDLFVIPPVWGWASTAWNAFATWWNQF